MLIDASSFDTPLVKSYFARPVGAQNNRDTATFTSQKSTNNKLSETQQAQVQTLKARDREVRNHEQAHIGAAAGIAVSGAHYSYTTGPDGIRYAIGGDVSIDTSSVPGDPEATIRKADTIRRAAMAPANPSSQDYSVAGKASQMANAARMELLKSQQQASQAKGGRLNVIA